MNPTPDTNSRALAQVEEKLAHLQAQVEAMQGVLMRLLQDVVHAEDRLARTQTTRLAEVNEQLVVSALVSQEHAEAAAQALKDLAQSALLDPLTKLATRTTLHDRYLQAVANARRHRTRFAVLFVDLDNFKQINDTQGHAFGDRVLRGAAQRLAAAVREVDTVSRHGGDEFVVLLAELNHPDDAQAVADKLVAAIGAPVEFDGRTFQVTGSAGIAIYPDDGEDIDTLVAWADAAMYESKRRREGGAGSRGSMPAGGAEK